MSGAGGDLLEEQSEVVLQAGFWSFDDTTDFPAPGRHDDGRHPFEPGTSDQPCRLLLGAVDTVEAHAHVGGSRAIQDLEQALSP